MEYEKLEVRAKEEICDLQNKVFKIFKLLTQNYYY